MNDARPDMNEWEEQINALLDGELDDAQAEALKSAAEGDQALARAIIEAYQLQQLLSAMPAERAPDSLRARLQAIPAEQAALQTPAASRRPAHESAPASPWWSTLLQPRWAMALAMLPLVVLVTMQTVKTPQGDGPRQPTQAELAQARQDFALAMAYLQKASMTTGREIESTIDSGMSDPVMENTVRTLADQLDLNKEQEA